MKRLSPSKREWQQYFLQYKHATLELFEKGGAQDEDEMILPPGNRAWKDQRRRGDSITEILS